ncbi:MAG TPA: hypothetical protein VF824_17120 [Thermoanaerobaculia bacterium]|jgi:hypothetical protein
MPSPLDAFLARYDPEIAATARAARAKLRKLLPGAFELVYDNYNALAIGYAPSDRTSEAILSLALYPRWVTLFFLRGVTLDDPGRILRGSGKLVRHIVLEDARDLDRDDVRALIAQATHGKSFANGKLIVKSISNNQRPRRPRG